MCFSTNLSAISVNLHHLILGKKDLSLRATSARDIIHFLAVVLFHLVTLYQIHLCQYVCYVLYMRSRKQAVNHMESLKMTNIPSHAKLPLIQP
jgi:hypothetical protein